MKPRTSWIIAACCLALLCGAMAWTTHSMLGMEREQGRMADEAAVQEMARLALWRMESIASALVIEESARSPEQYRPFSAPEALVDNRTNLAVKQGDLLSVSPLLRELPQEVLLHFEMDASGTIRSPQVPVGRDLVICQSVHAADPQFFAACTTNLSSLSGILDKGAGAEKIKSLRATLKVPPELTGNKAYLWSANHPMLPPAPAQADNGKPAEEISQAVSKKSDGKTGQVQALNGYAAQQSLAIRPEQFRAQQSEFNAGEEKARADFVKSGTGKLMSRRLYNPGNNNEDPGQNPQTKEETGQKPSDAPAKETSKSESLPASAATPSSAVNPAGNSGPPALSDFRPLWLGDALVLTRRVSMDGRESIQGAWLDWNKLRGEFQAAVEDLFPNAKIVPAPEKPPAGAHLLASLPIQLIPGALTFIPRSFWTPLKVSLGIAWVCVLLAIAAVAMVLRGMMSLSERRASFVSSVTHELRTPLATFKLYSEMLADGMVKEEAKKQQYLETLTGEADRLGHLVENVLSYSRIERGKGPAAACAAPVGDLLRRCEPRLNQRAMMAGMDFSLDAPEEVMAMALRTDAGAVDQILCNLVDNACKYGRREGVPGKVELVATRERRRVCFAVRDYGPGIAPGEEKKLFLPFHKSAREAAHSKPGVGLGLALCRRLAQELGGTLEIDRSWRLGASFVLRLPW